MKYLLAIYAGLILALLLSGCSPQPVDFDKATQNCKVTKQSGQTIVICPDGSQETIEDGKDGQSITGPKGDTGLKGDKGDKGDQGDAGSNGTSVTMVRLCPGTPNYGTFIEVAFCINNKLYATYSANGGFSTEIFPGFYASNGINSSCAFEVQANCSIVWH